MTINQQAIANILSRNNNGFATIEYVSKIQTAAAFKDMLIQKHCSGQVQLFHTETAYETAVKRTAISGDASDFKKGESHFEHDPDCYSIVHSSGTGNTMLYCRFIRVLQVEYLLNGKVVKKEAILPYLTPSTAKKLQDDSGVVYNATNDVEHKVIMRTIGLSSLRRIAFGGQVLGEKEAFHPQDKLAC